LVPVAFEDTGEICNLIEIMQTVKARYNILQLPHVIDLQNRDEDGGPTGRVVQPEMSQAHGGIVL
jgi:hypothetical protein